MKLSIYINDVVNLKLLFFFLDKDDEKFDEMLANEKSNFKTLFEKVRFLMYQKYILY